MMSIKTYPNQRVYKTVRPIKKNVQLIMVAKEDMQVAYRLLTPNELVVWLDCVSNKEGHAWAYSPQDFHERYGMSVSGARQAFGSLETKGFACNVGGNRFRVYTQSQLPENAHYYAAELSVEDDW